MRAARQRARAHRLNFGREGYMSPEMFRQHPFSPHAADVWSLVRLHRSARPLTPLGPAGRGPVRHGDGLRALRARLGARGPAGGAVLPPDLRRVRPARATHAVALDDSHARRRIREEMELWGLASGAARPSDSVVDLLQKILSPPLARLSLDEVVRHPWMAAADA
jgi:hypothetical protein